LTVEYDAHAPPMPIHFSNPDVLWKSEHPFPRFGQGAFKLALRALYTERLRFLRVPSETIDERIAAFKQWGKPTEATFRFLEDRLRELSPKPGPVTAERFYMVGDNPTSDIEGARRANIHHRKGGQTSWQGVLVRTGVYKEGDETNGAAAVVDGVAEAVDYILQREASFQ
jgi:ribonucleotide monophosphatase NagD (HAD superfamily)